MPVNSSGENQTGNFLTEEAQFHLFAKVYCYPYFLE
jgi:hypothetical protein